MTLVIDASVAIKWFVPEAGSEEALALLSRRLVAPDLFVAETGHLFSKKVRLRELSPLQSRLAFEEVRRNVSVFGGAALASAAFELSLALHHSIYDCWYLAGADALGLPFVTADAIVAAKVRASGASTRIYLLGEEIADE
ncbi:MAG TPA: type II toxin-antitoxin system VapC family toxin [Allosphingosinicella sp.]|nr:type II toxin-antitoxin system VapC family toxin [Allosphingosinicella sp.]